MSVQEGSSDVEGQKSGRGSALARPGGAMGSLSYFHVD